MGAVVRSDVCISGYRVECPTGRLLGTRRLRAQIARHDGNDAGQRKVELSHGKEKVYGSIP